MDDIIVHQGVVSNIGAAQVTVCIQQKSACSGCHAAGYCSSVDCKDRYITVDRPAFDLAVGDLVELKGQQSMGRLAVFLSFVLPILLLIIVLTISIRIFLLSEGMSALFAFGSLFAYYGTLALFNKQLRRKFVFTIRKTNLQE